MTSYIIEFKNIKIKSKSPCESPINKLFQQGRFPQEEQDKGDRGDSTRNLRGNKNSKRNRNLDINVRDL